MADNVDAPTSTAAPTSLLSSPVSCHGDAPSLDSKSVLERLAEERTEQTAEVMLTSRLAHASPGHLKSMAQQTKAPPKGCARRANLNLLQLPNDILEIIIKDVTHTNDLCALSLTCSALHSFAVRHIYSRFDIVWPDSTAHVDPKSGVDALTYGLSTLAMAEELFGEGAQQQQQQQQPVQCEACGHVNLPAPSSTSLPQLPDFASPLNVVARRRRRYGNHYAQYCRKFSLGNGPKEWVQDYMISREAGKLLGTQVALALARMRNLESFVWDMPTGILHEVWMALASLDDRADGRPCRLERVWVRWHNHEQLLLDTELPDEGHAAEYNHAGPHPSAGSLVMPPSTAQSSPFAAENFSILPPLRSLSVLDVDLASYLQQMAILIGKSRHCLRELRVGIASHVDWSSLTDDLVINLHTGTLEGGQRKLGGVLGALFAHVLCVTSAGILRGPVLQDGKSSHEFACVETARPDSAEHNLQSPGPIAGMEDKIRSPTPQKQASSRPVDSSSPISGLNALKTALHSPASKSQTIERQVLPIRTRSGNVHDSDDVSERLSLEILELERVPLSVFTLREALDWSNLTEITLLDCGKHEQFWRALRRQFSCSSTRPNTWQTHSPTFASQVLNKSPRLPSKTQKRSSYTLHIRKIHVNAVSPALIAFTRDALAPHTLQTLFLHASSATESQYNLVGRRHVSLDQIYRGPIRRHARSLTKLSIDSGLRSPTPNGSSATILAPSRKSWTLTRDVLAFLTSGKLRALRELAVCLDHHDWHFFLQRLPALCHLRSLYIPQIHDRVTGRPMAALSSSASLHLSGAREFAQQVVDIVVLRPEVQLCYLGMFDKCFEILEGPAVSGDVSGGGEDEEHDDDEDEVGSTEDDEGDDTDEGEQQQHHHHHDLEADDDVIAQGFGPAAPHAPQHGATTDEEHDLHADDDDDDDDGDDAVDALATDTEEEEDEDESENNGDESGDEDHEVPVMADGYFDDGTRAHGDRIRLREILFYDDKVAVFRARLGRL